MALALGGRTLLDPLLGERYRFAALFVVVPLVAARYGLRAGLTAVAAGALGVASLAALHVGSWGRGQLEAMDFVVYLVLACLITWIAAALREARRRADESATEAHARSQALARSDERYRSFIHQSSEGIWRIELSEPVPIDLPEDEQIARFYRHGRLAECNDAMARMYGFESASEMVGASLDALLVPSDPANREYLLAFIRSGYRLSEAESHERDRNGAPKYFLNNLIGTIENGCVVRAWGTQRDVTERRHAEEALRASEERLRLALEAGQMGIWDLNLISGEVKWADTSAPAGLEPGSFDTYETFLAIVHPDDRARVRAAVGDAIARGTSYEAEFRIVRPDGTLRWTLGKGQIIGDDDGRPTRMIGIGVDVTGRKRAEEELRASERRFKLAVAAAEMGLWDWDLRSGDVTWSERAREIAGFPALAPSAPAEKLLSLVHPDDHDRMRAVVERARTEGKGEGTVFRLCRPDGAVRWVLVYGRVSRGRDAAIERITGVVTDVTREKQAELEVQQSLLREREARAEAERSNRAKDEFLATLSHELRSPLSAALSWTSLLRRGLLDDDKRERALETIERNTRLQVRLIEDLLDISRIVSGKLTLEVGVVDARAVVDAAVDAARGSAELRKVALEVQRAPETLLVAGDPARLEQVVGNLLANAIKFTPAGGRITVASRRVGERAEIVVSDSGIGIAPEVLPHVFDRFRQADSSTTRRYGGLGLGLAIVRHLVALHDGTVAAESPGENRGTVMRVQLPLESSMAASVPGADAPATAGHGLPPIDGVHVLVVDDEADICDLLTSTILIAGGRATAAASVSEALAQIDTMAPDVILTDLAMPNHDGYALLRELRASTRAGIPVVALTALASIADRQRALAAGFDVHLTKPVDPVLLITTIARIVARARAVPESGRKVSA